MANFGIGLGAFMDGAMRGANFTRQIQNDRLAQEDLADRRKIRAFQLQNMEQQQADQQAYRAVAKDAAAQATSARAADVNAAITPGADGASWTVGGKTYSSEADARKAADGQVDSFMDYYMKNSVPKMMEHWTSTGEIDKAQAMAKMMEDENFKKGARLWGSAVRSFQVGDREGFKKNLMGAYNQQGYFEDGTTATKIEDVKNDKGQLTGYAITFKGADGKETTQNYDGEDVARMGLNALSPTQVISYGMDQLKARQTAAAEIAKEGRSEARDMRKLGVQQANTLEAQANASNLRQAEEAEKQRTGGASTKVREAEAIGAYLRRMGKDEDYIRSMAPRLVGIERQSQSPQDRLSSMIKVLSTDIDFQDLPDKEKVQKAQDMIKLQDAALAEEAKVTPPAASPTLGAKPPVQSGGGIPVWDSKTNSIIYR